MMTLSKEEFEETKKIFKEIRLQANATAERLAFLLTRFYGENVVVEAKFKVLGDPD